VNKDGNQSAWLKPTKASLSKRLRLWYIKSSFWPPLAAFAGLFIVWELLTIVFSINPIILPSASAITMEFFQSFTFYISHAWVTFYEAVLGFLLGLSVAFMMGIIMSHSSVLERTLLPLAVLANVTPIMAVAPLFVLWFGFGTLPKVLVAAIITFFPMLINSIMGFRSIDDNHYEYMRSLHASKAEIFMKLRLPNSLPYLFSAAKTCVSLSVMGAVVGEWSGSSRGLGNVIMMSSNYSQTTRMFAAIFMLAIMGIGLTNFIRYIERKVLYWHTSVNG
jgi:NitT/TauT family transport system permease protein